MKDETRKQLDESYNHIKPYLNDESITPELRQMCLNCERYCGNEHDYTECCNMMCFKFYLAFEFLEWSNSFNS